MKAQRKVCNIYIFFVELNMNSYQICGALKSGVRVYEHSKTTLVTGCTTHPGDHRYCSAHKDEQHPAIASSKLTSENRQQLENRKEKDKNYKEQDFTDNVYIVEGTT